MYYSDILCLFLLRGYLLWWCKGSDGWNCWRVYMNQDSGTNRTSSHCIIHHHACGVFLKSAFSLKNVCDEAIKMMNVIKPRNMCWNVKYFRDVQWLSWGKALMGLSELQATGLLLPTTPWWNTFLYTWKNNEYLADIFSNMNAKACYLRGKQLMGLVYQW